MDRVSTMLSFTKVAELGGFAAAARQLNLANSLVTAHVKSLEERLGARLLNRTTRSVSLTETGRAFYERCAQILSEIEDAEGTVQELHLKPRGILRVNTSPAVPMAIAPSIAEYNELYPDVKVHLATTSRMLDLVEQGFDLAVFYSDAQDLSLIRRHLASYHPLILASPDYLSKHGHPQHPTDLAKHNCVVYYDGPFGKGGCEWRFTGSDGEFTIAVSGSPETNNADSLRAAALNGQGIIYVAAHLVSQELSSGRLVPVLNDYLGQEISLHAFYPNRQYLSTKVRTFIDLVAKNFRQFDWDPYAPARKRPVNTGEELA